MKTSWDDIDLVENYLDGSLAPEEKSLFEKRQCSDPTLKGNVLAQKEVRLLVKKYYLLKLRHQAKDLHHRLYNDPSRRGLRQAIEALFKY